MISARKRKRSAAPFILLLLLWILLVLYPNPARLAASVYRLKSPPVQPFMVSDLARDYNAATPCEIKEQVYLLLPYSYDWYTYNMPWYFPTLGEALEKGAGDCKARYLLFASILEELEIPYQKNISLSHIWVGYEGKPDSRIENAAEAVLILDPSGRARLSLPRTDPGRLWQNLVSSFWEAMPLQKKALLLAGFPLVYLFSETAAGRKPFRREES